MITSASLLTIAAEAEARYLQLLAQHPPGTVNDERNEAWDRAKKAQLCAQWLDKRGGGPLAYVGPFGGLAIKKGSAVRIRRGAIVHSTNPTFPRDGKAYQGTRPIKVFSVDVGYASPDDLSFGDGGVFQPRIHWAGAGGYWCWADANDTEIVRAG